MGVVGTFGVVACVQEVAVPPGKLLADADLIHYTLGASEKDEEATRKAVDFSKTLAHRPRLALVQGRTARNPFGEFSPCEARLWDWKLGPAAPHYL